MRLRTKFNLVLALAFAIGLALAGLLSYRIVQENARAEVLTEARIMMESALAIRAYTTREIRPLLEPQMAERFLPHTVPSFAAQTNFRAIRERFPDYTYKEAALNPTNLADRAADWEADIIRNFRNDNARHEVITLRDTPTGQVLILAHPLQVGDRSCLGCHGRVEDAPATMRAIYGTSNGFGWGMNEVIGAQVVSIPLSVPLARAMTTFLIFMGSLLAVFLVIAVLLNILLQVVVIRPVLKIAEVANAVSLGNMDVPEYTRNSRDEIGSLSASFNRMRRSLEGAMQMLNE